ncbi:DUF3168 domain-containing protein [Paenibacillus larvae]|uniref:Tail protein n=22 Tax=root TaxID=1 RepID=A0A0K2CY82_9CAUD|nr:DUF3168 domain-containing protein [Paenibacillus larvae]YP_008320346.1 tail terminator [Paenibacillus phage phiIBB_P123]YP_009195200.1 tail terminator [Paenibacillus phage HB10c2]YP_009197955.1 tail terminator [Paenibacillus phage Diva]YP_009201920.1 tail terminator [Paenibacillus phage Xenia]YP_009203212.1 tail terminator [Paenibacillus phage Fern]YP_009203455.1 tail terminator [Paenibacillus phage Sitara]YP_009224876.1 tail terminator [Paenibacillus phage Rani]YP_009593419.1 tail termi
MTKLYEVQEAVYRRLTSDTALMPMIKGVYDYVPEKTLLPYVTFSRVYSEPFETKTSTGEIVTLTLDVFSEAKGKKESIHILKQIEASLTPELEVEGAFLMDQSVVSREVQEIAESLYQATIEYKIKLDWSE